MEITQLKTKNDDYVMDNNHVQLIEKIKKNDIKYVTSEAKQNKSTVLHDIVKYGTPQMLKEILSLSIFDRTLINGKDYLGNSCFYYCLRQENLGFIDVLYDTNMLDDTKTDSLDTDPLYISNNYH